jgi:hypothetical protein
MSTENIPAFKFEIIEFTSSNAELYFLPKVHLKMDIVFLSKLLKSSSINCVVVRTDPSANGATASQALINFKITD